MGVMLDTIGQWIAGYLQKEVPGYEPFTPSDPEHLRGVIEPGDVLLVEGNNRISGIIKYLTQSTWSHGGDGAEGLIRRGPAFCRPHHRRAWCALWARGDDPDCIGQEAAGTQARPQA